MFEQFKATYNSIANAINYTEPLSYDQWLKLHDDYKAGALFVQFYDQICLAYRKLYNNATVEEECVSEILAYLCKNVYGKLLNRLHYDNLKKGRIIQSKYKLKKLKYGQLISASSISAKFDKCGNIYYSPIYLAYCNDGEITVGDALVLRKDCNGDEILPEIQELSEFDIISLLPDSEKVTYTFDKNSTKITESRFKPSYMYRLAWNCIYCKSVDYVNIESSWYNNTCSNIVNLSNGDELDILDTKPANDNFDYEIMSKKLWEYIQSSDEDTKLVIDSILNGTRLPARVKRSYDQILNNLKFELVEYKNYFIGA